MHTSQSYCNVCIKTPIDLCLCILSHVNGCVCQCIGTAVRSTMLTALLHKGKCQHPTVHNRQHACSNSM